MPIDDTARENAAVLHGTSGVPAAKKELRQRLRDESLQRWQRRWDGSTKGRWTHRLIPNIRAWVCRRHGEVNYYLTQLLSGHGCFRSYLHRFGHEASPECSWCGPVFDESPEHTFFICGRFRPERDQLEAALGVVVTPDTIVSVMLCSERNWRAVSHFAATVMGTLRRLERRRNAI